MVGTPRKRAKKEVAEHVGAYRKVKSLGESLPAAVNPSQVAAAVMGDVPADVDLRLERMSGRLAGAKDRVERIKLVMEAIGFNPLVELTRLASLNHTAEMFAGELRRIARKGMLCEEDTRLLGQAADYFEEVGNPKIGVDASKAVCEYFYPKLKSSEVKQQIDMGLTVTVQKYGD